MNRKMLCNLLTVALVVSVGVATEVDPCGDGSVPLPIHVDIKGCTRQPCDLVRGEDVIMIMNFTAPVPIETLRATARAQPEGNEGIVSYPLPKPNVCNELLNTHCPLEVNEPAVYKLVMPIFNFYPEIGLRLEFAIKHNGGQDNLVCFSVNCQVVQKS